MKNHLTAAKRHIRASLLLAGCLAAFASPGFAATNLLLNGGFESSIAPDNFLPAGNTGITAWTIGGTNVHFANPHPQNWPGNNTQFVDLTGNQGNGYIEQSFDTTVGKTYVVTLRLFNASTVYSTGGLRTTGLALTVTGSTAHTFDVTPGTEASLKYEFQATAARTTLRLADATGIDSNASWIDDVAVAEKPPVAVNWVNWTNVDTSSGTAKYIGTMAVPRASGGTTSVIVKYTPPPAGIAFFQTFGGTDYFRQGFFGNLGRNPARSPYTSAKVPNIPDGGGASGNFGDIIALMYAGTNKLEFFDAASGAPIQVASPVFAYVSLNGNGYGFNQDFDILSFGDGTNRDSGYWGTGTSYKSVLTINGAPQYRLLGTGEPHGTLQFRGSFSTVTWQSLSNENWNGFTIGVAQLAADIPIANAGLDQTIAATSASGASVQLSGSVSGSTNAPFTFTWTGAFGIASGQNPTVNLPVGTNTVTLAVSDSAGGTDSDTVVITVTPPPADTTKPVITAPSDIVTEATGPSGAVVTFTATATDNKDGNVPVVAAPPSGSTFPLGTTAVGLAASDAAGNTATADFDVTVQDTTAPVIAAPATIVAEATSAAGAAVNYSASANDLVDGSTAVIGSPGSGSVFALGNTSVNLTSSDSRGNSSSASFEVVVQDTTAPVISAPSNIVAEATSAAGAAVGYSASATDLVDGSTTVTGSPASDSVFALGTSTVALISSDSRGNTSSASFSVTVRDTTAPVIHTPASQTLEATSAAGAVAHFSATASDAVGVTALITSAASGSVFPIGTATVTVIAKDAAGNTSSDSFTITVQDTTAPALNVPANQILEATSAAGAVASFSASATDAVGVTSLTSSAASGSTFPIGTTTVTVVAQDAAGNTTSGSFTVTVRDTTAPVITSLTPSSAALWPPNHQMVAISLNASSSDLVGVTSLRIINVTSSEPDNGLGDGDTAGDIQVTGDLTLNLRAERSGKGNGRTYTITVEARDAAGNITTRTTSVAVLKSQGK